MSYPRKCLLMVYNSSAKSVIPYGLSVCRNTSKNDLEKIDRVQRKIIRAIFSGKKFVSLGITLIDNKTHTVYELYVIELVRELFKQIRSESPLQYIVPQSQHSLKTNLMEFKRHISPTNFKNYKKQNVISYLVEENI